MNWRNSHCLSTLMAALVVAICVTEHAWSTDLSAKQTATVKQKIAAERDFSLKVLPLLQAKCFACHGNDPKDIQGGLDVRSREGLLKGGDSETAAIEPGNPADSLLFQAVNWDGYEMPPKENDRLTKVQIELVKSWIAAGAPWPDAATQQKYRESERAIPVTAEGVIVKTSGGQADEWTYRRYQPDDLWSFKPLKKFEQPATRLGSAVIDKLIQAKLQKAGVKPAPTADALTLLRRATFDLTGLPPTPDEVKEFLAAWKRDSDKAWSDLIDRLLASPHYGERWAQHWLDITRYADTGGYSNDYERSNMWRYRDYIIRSLNNDKPYNQFIIEQLAGDELVDALQGKHSESLHQDLVPEFAQNVPNSELLIATGFLRMGPWDPAMVKVPEARQLFLDDVVNAVGQTFLSTTLRCVKCHDHKFDPIPTRDYYRIYAAFSGTQMAERPAAFLPSENREGFEAGEQFVKQLLKFATDEKLNLHHKREAAARAWYKEHNQEYVSYQKRNNLPDEEKPPRHVGLTPAEQGILKVREQDEWIWNRRLERYQPLVQSVYNGPTPGYLNARKLRMPGNIKPKTQLVSYIYNGGSLEAPGEKVQPGVMSALGIPVNPGAVDADFVINESLHGRRLALANWIANPQNSLTARSIVNRLWQHHFGKAIAGNPNNFGAKGDKPTHPELLDWLAVDFVEHGWMIKRMHKQIMLSRTYRQASQHADYETLRNQDPDNHLLAWFPARRLTAEELRDAMLKVTGELNPVVGGLPAMPEMNLEVALQPRMIQFSIAPAYQPSRTPAERNRRSIYAYRVRGQADPFLEVFNQPTPNESCESRDTAAVSPQAFTLMNSDVMSDRAIAFALRVQNEDKTLDGQVQRAFALAFGRSPNPHEQARLQSYVSRMRNYHRRHQPDKVTYPVEITRSLVEELSGRPFEYTEILPAFKNYTADKKAADVSPETRALADMCLLLLNSHEFLYVY